ncbi:MAG: hypothetical protein WCC74_03015 [Minisyncoccia bacterium]
MSKLKIIYNKDFDVKRVINTIKKIDWFVENKYEYKKFSFPKVLDVEKLKDYSDEEIENAVISEYDEEVYKKNETFLINHWYKISEEIKNSFSKSSIPVQNEYIIYFTKYGTGGSYNLPNTVIINLTSRWEVGMLRTIIHEIIHLAIEENIIKYKIGQAQKERIVDLFFVYNFPRRVYMQNVYNSTNTGKIDQTFDDNFPDMNAVIEKSSQ